MADVVKSITHKTVFRNRPEPYLTRPDGTPIEEKAFWAFFVSYDPVSWSMIKGNVDEFRKMYGDAAAEKLLADPKRHVPEHIEREKVAAPGEVVWGGEADDRPPAEEPTHENPQITDLGAKLDQLLAAINAGDAFDIKAAFEAQNAILHDIASKCAFLMNK